jgi:Methyltransferase domain
MHRGLCRVAVAPRAAEGRCIVTEAERQVADLLPIEVDPHVARATVREVPFWFHTFAVNRAAGIYTAGAAPDHRYRVSILPSDVGGMGRCDRQRAVPALGVASRWGVELPGGEGFRTIHRLLGSAVEYRCMDAFELDRPGERFDLVYCCGILHRAEDPLGLLRVPRGRTASGGTVLVET